MKKYGVFQWTKNGNGWYDQADAVRWFARESDAQRFADRENERNGTSYVVRTIGNTVRPMPLSR